MLDDCDEEIVEDDYENKLEKIEETSNSFTWNNGTIIVRFDVENDWGDGYQCKDSIENISDSKIEDCRRVIKRDTDINFCRPW